MKRGKRNRINRKIHVSLLALLMFHSSGWIQRSHDNRLGAIHELNISEKRNSGGKEEIVQHRDHNYDQNSNNIANAQICWGLSRFWWVRDYMILIYFCTKKEFVFFLYLYLDRGLQIHAVSHDITTQAELWFQGQYINEYFHAVAHTTLWSQNALTIEYEL